MPGDRQKSSGREAVQWVRDTIRSRGAFGALKHYATGTVDLLRDLTPTRRRSRYGDVDFDFDHNVDTTWATITLRTRFRELLSGGQYQPSEPELFHLMMDVLPFPVKGFTFVDLGSGKGRTLLMASDYPFARIIGVELLAELNRIATNNIAAYFSPQQRCFNIQSLSLDARGFRFPPEPMLLYLFNPFPETVLREVLDNLRASLGSAPRDLYLLYHNLVHERAMHEQPWLERMLRTSQYALYKGVPER